MFLLDIWLRK